MSFPPPLDPASSPQTTSRPSLIKKFDLDKISLKANFYEHGLRSLSRSSSLGTHESQRQSSVTLKSSILRLSNSVAQSARLDSLIKREATQRDRQVKLLAFGQRPSTVIKRLRFALASPPQPEEVERCRRMVVPSAVKSLLSLAEYVGNSVALFHIVKKQSDIQVLESFVEAGGPAWEVSVEVSKAAMSLWTSPRVQECFKNMNQDYPSAYFLMAREGVLQPDYEPTLTDIVKSDEDQKATATEAKLAVEDISVDIIDAPQPKLQRFMRHFDDADAFLITLDLSTYDHYPEGSNLSSLELTLQEVKNRCRHNWHGEKPVIVVMYNTAVFRRKVAVSSNHFSDCRPPKDFQAAKDYVLQRCRRVIHPEQPLFYHYSEDDAEDPLIVDFFKKSVLELPHLIACIKNLNHLVGITPKPGVYMRRHTKARSTPKGQRSASLPIL